MRTQTIRETAGLTAPDRMTEAILRIRATAVRILIKTFLEFTQDDTPIIKVTKSLPLMPNITWKKYTKMKVYFREQKI